MINAFKLTCNSLSDPELFKEGITKDKQLRLKIVSDGGTKALAVAKLNGFQRFIAWLGFGSASLKKINRFLDSEEGRLHISSVLNSIHGEKGEKTRQAIEKNLKILRDKSIRHNQQHSLLNISRIANLIFFPEEGKKNPAILKKQVNFYPKAKVLGDSQVEEEDIKDHVGSSLRKGKAKKADTKQEGIDLNLCESTNRPQWVPKSSISATGMVSSQNFMYNCIDQHNIDLTTKKDRLKWFFEQRKFPSFSGAGTDTMRLDIGGLSMEDMAIYFKRPVDKNGYATSISAHSVLNAFFIQSSFVKRIYPCKDVEFLPGNIPVGVYEDGKKMIQQQAIRGCVAACAAMLIEDRGKKCNVESLKTTNLAVNKDLIGWIHQAGLLAEEKKVDIKQLKDLISKHGSVSVSVNDKDIGAHQIIVDAIIDDQVEIRDPNHGWRIAIPLSEFMKLTSKKIDCVYIH